jgi:hypothetical protein
MGNAGRGTPRSRQPKPDGLDLTYMKTCSASNRTSAVAGQVLGSWQLGQGM